MRVDARWRLCALTAASMLVAAQGFTTGSQLPRTIPLYARQPLNVHMIGKKLKNPPAPSGKKRAAVKNFLKNFLGLGPQASMPDASIPKCSSCFFPTEFHKVPLMEMRDYNYDTKVLTFQLPPGVSLELPVASCLLLQAFDLDGQEVIRPYTPISPNWITGKFSLLIKVYEKGVASQWLSQLKIGSMVAFKQLPVNLKAQYPFGGKSKINMICGGTGITPMYQILLHLANSTDSEDVEVVLLCGNKLPVDILLRDELNKLAEEVTRWDETDVWTRKTGLTKASSRIKVVHVLGDTNEPTTEGPFAIPAWDGEVGWVDKERVSKYCFPPSEDVLTFVCGVPGLYETMCGPRTEAEIMPESVLANLGYTKDMVCKL